MTSRFGSRFSDASDSGEGKKILKVKAYSSGTLGEREKIEITKGKLSQWTIDFADYFQKNSVSIPSDLDGKGFRAYCATWP